jgi:hypothetical protein
MTTNVNEISANPKIGMIKGVLAILLGITWLNNMCYGAWLSSGDARLGLLWGGVILSVCTWRGITSIRKRNISKVSMLNVSLWLGALLLTIVYMLYIFGYLR